MKTLVTALALTLAPAAALACGGMFCNNAQPVTQSAERILFAQDGDTIHMHVRVSYAGPPQDFGWLLPVPSDVEVGLSSEAAFQFFDQQFAPRFQLQQDFGPNCPQRDFDSNAVPEAGGGQDPGVDVLSREAVGPYDQVILRANAVGDLRRWLDENEFAIPDRLDDVLQPYIDAGAVFVALKLLPGADTGDIQPIRLQFSGARPVVPIIPTSVAADPDMGIIVHVLGAARAVPTNYAHVQINEAAIDWIGGGQNYPDVVSQAVDEAGGKAFTTDFAGPINLDGAAMFQPIGAAQLARVEAAETLGDVLAEVGQLDADLARVLDIEVPEGVGQSQFFGCPECFGDIDRRAAVDGEAVAARIRAEINPARESLGALFARHGYMTRLYTTMSAFEMDSDPLFGLNPDLEDVSATRVAIDHIVCGANGQEIPTLRHIETSGGLNVSFDRAQENVILRQDGATVRGMAVPGARIIEQIAEAGQPMVVEDRSADINERLNGLVDNAGCACDASAGEGGTPAVFGLLGLTLLGLRRRRRLV